MNYGKPPGTRLSITILGSGDPIANPTRASSGYVVWLDNVPRLLVDAGGGTFVRLGELRVDVPSIDTVFLTHTHIDHTGGLAPVVMAAYMQGRTTHLRVVGPAGQDMHPGCERFANLLSEPPQTASLLINAVPTHAFVHIKGE